MKLILGAKQGMTHLFREDGRLIPVTKVLVGINYITGKRNEEKDGYSAIQIGYKETRKARKPQKGQFGKIKTPDLRFLKEVRVEPSELEKHKEGEQFGAEIFENNEQVKVTAISKGKGYQGVIKRHGFHRGPMGHGSDHHREPGSIGSAYPQHVMKGTKLPGQTGRTRVSVRNLEIAEIDAENGILYVKGAIPGPNKGLVMITGNGEFNAEIKPLKKEARKEATQETGKEVKKEEKETTKAGKPGKVTETTAKEAPKGSKQEKKPEKEVEDDKS